MAATLRRSKVRMAPVLKAKSTHQYKSMMQSRTASSIFRECEGMIVYHGELTWIYMPEKTGPSIWSTKISIVEWRGCMNASHSGLAGPFWDLAMMCGQCWSLSRFYKCGTISQDSFARVGQWIRDQSCSYASTFYGVLDRLQACQDSWSASRPDSE